MVDAFPEQMDAQSLLAGIDPYSVTIFNQLQMRVLASELSSIVPTSEQERSSLDAVRELAEEGSTKPHHFLWFFGD